MALFFEEENTKVSLPFINDYVGDQKTFRSEVFYLESIKPSKKGTGLLLYCDRFVVFLFKNSKQCKRVVEICEKYQGGSYYPLIVQTMKSDPFFQLGLDDESQAYYEAKKDDFLNSISWVVTKIDSDISPQNPQSPHTLQEGSPDSSSAPNSTHKKSRSTSPRS